MLWDGCSYGEGFNVNLYLRLRGMPEFPKASFTALKKLKTAVAFIGAIR